MRNQFDKIIKFDNKHFKYNSHEQMLQWVDRNTGEVLQEVGLSKDNAKVDLMGYVHGWNEELNEELYWLMKDFESEMDYIDKL